MSVCAMRDKKGELLCGRLATPALLDRGNAAVVVAPMGPECQLAGWGQLILICRVRQSLVRLCENQVKFLV